MTLREERDFYKNSFENARAEAWGWRVFFVLAIVFGLWAT